MFSLQFTRANCHSAQAAYISESGGGVTASRADYSHLYWPQGELAAHPSVDLGVFGPWPHLSPESGLTINEIEHDGFPIKPHSTAC